VNYFAKITHITGDARIADPERGAATAEYAIATVAAAGFAGLLAAILQSAAVKDMVTGLITQALAFVL
jgi:hypothetical protein